METAEELVERLNKSGGSAFPCGERKFQTQDCIVKIESSSGMTLRDWFAGQALNGLCANGELEKSVRIYENKLNIEIDTVKYYPQIAYELADAMLKERQK